MTVPEPPTGADHPFFDEAVARRLLDDGTVLFAALADDGTIRWMSESSAFLLGTASADLLGRNALEILHEDDHEIVIETMAEAARGAEDRIRVALRLRHARDGWISLEFGGIDLREPDGTGLFLVWGSPHEATGRLLGFLNLLLAGADLDDLLAQVAVWHDDTMPGTRTTILVREPDGGYRNRARSASLPAELAVELPPTRADDADTPWGRAVHSAATEVEVDLDRLPPSVAAAAAAGDLRAVWAVPVTTPGQPHPSAVVVSWRSRPGPMLATHRRQVENTLQIMRLAIEWSTAQRDLVAAATTDSLTGLANRTQLESRVDEDRSALAAVLFVDLDDFKAVNDHHGHQVGDRILTEAARRMEGAVRATDLLVRLGGDEFAVWCADLDEPSTAERVAERLVATMDVPIEVDGHAHHIGCSVGVALVAADDPQAGDLAHLLTAADRALYRAKRAGKGRWVTVDHTPPLPFT
ncbi:GGDEF domain-containing protein [Aquihabitans sp. G128]|uniref:sensor domain-containing protein n=1 Tax=Aquihabitans sp. G128 TaxID=2849779 RepID=UPI001C2140D5|nr:GGDEF domain-containing protein [Aquihabitans sp. G128]QXC61799.1 GGDEF domain-containing protein [Aquihabitans sp. G128]